MPFLTSNELFGLVIFSVIAVLIFNLYGAVVALAATVYINDKRKTGPSK